MHIQILQHVPFEGPGNIEKWTLEKGHTLGITRLYAQEQFPPLEQFDMLVVMGGPMSVHDEHHYTWLKAEKWFIRQVIEAEKPVLGVCLGAQLIAEVLGGRVLAGKEKEIGWFPIELEPTAGAHPALSGWPSQLTVYHWHGETFTLPEGAQRVAGSKICKNQGFIYKNRVFALQFHLETTEDGVHNLIEYCGDELCDAHYIQSAEQQLGERKHYVELYQRLVSILDYMASLA